MPRRGLTFIASPRSSVPNLIITESVSPYTTCTSPWAIVSESKHTREEIPRRGARGDEECAGAVARLRIEGVAVGARVAALDLLLGAHDHLAAVGCNG